jgi:hypothetical protein
MLLSTSRFSGLLVSHDHDVSDVAILGEVAAQLVLADGVSQAADEQLLHGGLDLAATRVLARRRSLRLDLATVDYMRPVAHHLVHHGRLSIRHLQS